MEMFVSHDPTVNSVGTITSPLHALNFVKQYHDTPDNGLVSILRLNARKEVIGVTHNKTDMDLAWEVATVHDAVNEKGCVGIIVLYDKMSGNLPATGKEVETFDSLHRKLAAVQLNLIDVLAVGKGRFYSYADERVTWTD